MLSQVTNQNFIGTGLPFQDVCVACSTPPGSSGLAVIRLSGADSAAIAGSIFRLPGNRKIDLAAMPGNTCRFGRIISPADGSLIDEVVLTRFVAPRSYTGEDLIEISCHGGSAVKQAILDALIHFGARPAEPGEFSRRAFANGKIDLSQAEAVMDLISATTSRAAAAAARQLEGGLLQLVRQHLDSLYGLMARTELILEFPEHDDLDSAAAGLAADITEAAASLHQLAATFRQGRILHDGMTIVIAGRPNVGKSSLLNSLARRERAIVTDIPGTTRDTIEELVDVDGIPVRLIDTAGLRDSEDTVEQLGIGRARAAIEAADLVFYLISPPWQPESEQARAEIAEIKTIAALRPLLLLCGKADLPAREHLSAAVAAALPELPLQSVSTLTGEGQAEIRQAISDTYQSLGVPGNEDLILTNTRHHALVKGAASSLQEAADALMAGITLDIAAVLLRSAADSLAEITGDAVSDTLVETIFSRFCVGK